MKAPFGRRWFWLWWGGCLAGMIWVGRSGGVVGWPLPGGTSGWALEIAGEKGEAKSEPSEGPKPEKPVPKKDHKNLFIDWDEEGREHPVRTIEDWQRRRADILQGFQEAAGSAAGKVPPNPVGCPDLENRGNVAVSAN